MGIKCTFLKVFLMEHVKHKEKLMGEYNKLPL